MNNQHYSFSPVKIQDKQNSDSQQQSYQSKKEQQLRTQEQNNLSSSLSFNNQDIMDQKQQYRQSLKLQKKEGQYDTLQMIIKQEFLEQQESTNFLQQNKTILIANKSLKSDDEQLQFDKIAYDSASFEKPQNLITNKISNQQIQKKSQVKSLKIIKPMQSKNFNINKFILPNSPQLFVSAESLLPNQIICIQNNSTRVIVHMNKKIVPIPSANFIQSSKNQGQNFNKSPQKSKSTLPSVQCPYLLGKLIVTNFKLAYIDSLYPNTMTFCLPLNYIYKLQRTIQQSNGISYVQIGFKTGLGIKFKYPQQEFSYSQKIKDIILTLIHKNMYAAIDFGQQQFNKQLLCQPYDQSYFNQEENSKIINRLQADIIDNRDWKQMSAYPQKYMVPLKYLGKRNVQTRIVILSYIYTVHNQKVGLWRTGPGLPDPYQDEWVPKTKASNKHYTIEIKNKGIGMSKSQATRLVQIQGLYLLRQSFQKVKELSYHNHESSRWFNNICGTRWYEQIASLMNEAQSIIQLMSAGINVTLLCQTEARGAQICAIVQLLMCPFYRTFEGFPHLIQKQFLHYGCPKTLKKQRQEDKSIILVQFLDCVYQFTHLYPLSFEFSEHYLVFIAQHIISNKYGNFLYITRQFKKQIQRKQILLKCVCIWKDIKRKLQKDKKKFFESNNQNLNSFRLINKKSNKKSMVIAPVHQTINYYIYFNNSFYIDHNESNIFELRNHSEVSKGIRLWSSYFMKKVYCSESLREQVLFSNQIQKRYLRIAYEHNMMKKSNETMRKKLGSQFQRIGQKKQLLKELKRLQFNE